MTITAGIVANIVNQANIALTANANRSLVRPVKNSVMVDAWIQARITTTAAIVEQFVIPERIALAVRVNLSHVLTN